MNALINRIRNSWRWQWGFQLMLMLIISLCSTYLPLFFQPAATFLRAVFLWILPLLVGPLTACRVTVCGLNCYVAWIVPPVIHTAVPWLCIGYPPPPLTMLLCAFLSLVGAAAGDVLARRK